MVMKPTGIKDDTIAAFLREEKRFRVSIRAIVGVEEMYDAWIMDCAKGFVT